MVFLACLFVVINIDELSPGLVGLTMSYAMLVSMYTLYRFTDSEHSEHSLKILNRL